MARRSTGNLRMNDSTMRQHEGTEDREDSTRSGGLNVALGDLNAIRQLYRSGFLSTVESNAKHLTAPFYWYAPDGPLGSRTLGGGTMCFIHTGHRLLGVTAAHVHRACVNRLEQEPETACQIGEHSFQPTERLIDLDDDLDLATYSLSEIQATAAGANIHAPPAWPPQPTADLYMIGGWLWTSTIEHAEHSTHHFLLLIGQLNSRSDRILGMEIHRSTSLPYASASLPPDLNIGGISGGPMYMLTLEPLVRLEMVGIIYEYHESYEFILARPLSRIAADGSLNRDPG